MKSFKTPKQIEKALENSQSPEQALATAQYYLEKFSKIKLKHSAESEELAKQYGITQADRKRVSELTLKGFRKLDILELYVLPSIEITEKIFKKDMEIGVFSRLEAISSTAFGLATSGKHPGFTQFYLKAVYGWSEENPEFKRIEQNDNKSALEAREIPNDPVAASAAYLDILRSVNNSLNNDTRH